MEARDIIIRPIITERAFDEQDDNRYTFEVARDANKIQIAQAVREVFNVHVVKVNTLNVHSKEKRSRWGTGQTRTWKKAIVTLAEGDSIELFANQE